MPVNLQSTPTANQTSVRIAFFNGTQMVASMDPDDSAVLTIVFDTITLFNSPNPPIPRTQNPNVQVSVVPGELAFVTTQGSQTLLHHAKPNQPEQVVVFASAVASKPRRKSSLDQGQGQGQGRSRA